MAVGLAATWMTVATLLFGVMAALAKGAAARLPGPEVAFVRFAVGLAVCGAVALRRPMRPRNWRGLFWRGAFGGAAVLGFFLTIEHLPVGVATLIQYSSPVFVALYAWLFLREPLGWGTLGALALATLGVMMVLASQAPPGSLGFGRWQLVGVLAAMLSGAAVATIREVRRTDGSWEIFTAFCVAGLLFTALPTARHFVAPTGHEWLTLGALGVVAVVAQLLMTYALGTLPATAAGLLFQLTPVSAMAIGRLYFDERPHAAALLGAAVTLTGVVWGAWLTATAHAAAAPGEAQSNDATALDTDARPVDATALPLRSGSTSL